MAGSWGSVLPGLTALALVVALSPITIIPGVLVLHAPRPRPAGLAFLGGWVAGLVALTAVFIGVSDLLGALHTTPPTWTSWLRVGLGSALILFGILRWLTRHRQGKTPRWMSSFAKLTPLRAGVTGAALVVLRPEVLIFCAAAGLLIGSSPLDLSGELLAGAFFVAVTASTVAVPILAYVGAGDRLDGALERLKAWMEQNHAALLGAVLVLLGLLLLYKGIQAL